MGLCHQLHMRSHSSTVPVETLLNPTHLTLLPLATTRRYSTTFAWTHSTSARWVMLEAAGYAVLSGQAPG
jgi:hypothetical protein